MAFQFPSGTSKMGTIHDSIYSIINFLEYLQNSGKILKFKELGVSGDGKVTNEFHVYPKMGSPFTIYDYKFGFDPSDEDHFEEEYDFSIGGYGPEAEATAKSLGFNVVNEMTEEELNEIFVHQMKYRAGIIK
jgi:hypothetical protein